MKKEVFKGEINGKSFDSIEEFNNAYLNMLKDSKPIKSCSYKYEEQEIDDNQLELFDSNNDNKVDIQNFYPSIDQALRAIVNAKNSEAAFDIADEISEDLDKRFEYFENNYKEDMADAVLKLRRESIDNICKHYKNAENNNKVIDDKINELEEKYAMNEIEMSVCNSFKEYYEDMLDHISAFDELKKSEDSEENDESKVEFNTSELVNFFDNFLNKLNYKNSKSYDKNDLAKLLESFKDLY